MSETESTETPVPDDARHRGRRFFIAFTGIVAIAVGLRIYSRIPEDAVWTSYVAPSGSFTASFPKEPSPLTSRSHENAYAKLNDFDFIVEVLKSGQTPVTLLEMRDLFETVAKATRESMGRDGYVVKSVDLVELGKTFAVRVDAYENGNIPQRTYGFLAGENWLELRCRGPLSSTFATERRLVYQQFNEMLPLCEKMARSVIQR